MDEPTQGIGDQPVSADDMAAIDQAADQFGSVVQPSNEPVNTQDEAPVVSTTAPTIEPPTLGSQPDTSPLSDTPIADSIDPPSVDPPSTVVQPSSDDAQADQGLTDEPAAPAEDVVAPVDPSTTTDDSPTPEPLADGGAEEEAPAEETPQEEASTAPVDEVTPQPVTDDGSEDDASTTEESEAEVAPTPEPVTPTASGDSSDEELLDVKQQALQELTPIVDKIDLPPEERFDTLMMIIRASDDKKLVKPAFDAAHEITDEDKKARALLDVVNEVNYLTHKDQNQE